MPPVYVKPYVKGGKNAATDAGAICEAVIRPNMRFGRSKAPTNKLSSSALMSSFVVPLHIFIIGLRLVWHKFTPSSCSAKCPLHRRYMSRWMA